MSKEIFELEFSGLLVSVLQAMNINSISAHFEGGGDSGSLSNVCEKSEYLVNFLGDRLNDFYDHIVEKHVDYNWYDNEGGRVDITIDSNGQIQIDTTIYDRFSESEELDVEISEEIKNKIISSANINKNSQYTVHLKKSGYDEGGDSDEIYHIAYKKNYEPAEISIDSSIFEYFDGQILGMTDEGDESYISISINGDEVIAKKIVTSEGVKEHLYNNNFIIEKDEKYLFSVEDREAITEKFLNINYSTDGFDKIKREIIAYTLIQNGNIDLISSHLNLDDITKIIDISIINNCCENTKHLILKNKHLREIIRSSKSERLDVESLKNTILIEDNIKEVKVSKRKRKSI